MRGRRMTGRLCGPRWNAPLGRGAGIIHGLPHLSRLQSSQSLHQNNCFFIFALTRLPPPVPRSCLNRETEREGQERGSERNEETPTSLPASYLVRRLPLARLGMSPRYRTRAFRFFPPIVRGTRRDSDLDSKSRNYKYYLIIIKASKK